MGNPGYRRKTRAVSVGPIQIGGGAPIAIQTMTKTRTDNVEETLRQIFEAQEAGCDLIRCAIPTIRHLDAFAEVVQRSPIPVVADIHFDWRIALGAIERGAAKIRINPGNMKANGGLEAVVTAARKAGVAIRIGVNAGSLSYDPPTSSREDERISLPERLATLALSYAEQIEALGHSAIVLSLKASDVMTTIAANRIVASRCDYPLHLGITEAGLEEDALLKSAVGIGALLADGIGDTLRLSFTAPPVREVLAAKELLRAAGYLRDRPIILSCPTCGRCSVDLPPLVVQVREAFRSFPRPLVIAVMGCEVNGPGEARQADLGLAAGGGRMTLFVKGQPLRTLLPEAALEALVKEAYAMLDRGMLPL